MKFDVLVVHIGENSKFTDSSPCPQCINFMKMYPIRRIYYTTGTGEITYRNLNVIKFDYVPIIYDRLLPKVNLKVKKLMFTQ